MQDFRFCFCHCFCLFFFNWSIEATFFWEEKESNCRRLEQGSRWGPFKD